jgi:hypothetical protein
MPIDQLAAFLTASRDPDRQTVSTSKPRPRSA